MAGKLSDERFARMSTKYEDEQKELRAKIKTLQEGIERTKSKAVTADTGFDDVVSVGCVVAFGHGSVSDKVQ